MAIDYVVDLDCTPKQALTVERMVGLIKSKNQALAIIEMTRSRGDERPLEQITFRRMVMRPQGAVEEKVNVKTLLAQSQDLEGYAGHCQGCKANLPARPFGCYGSIAYPIRARAEQWLMAQLPDSLESPAGYLLRSAVRDFKYTGGMFLNMRPKENFFESRTPFKRKWGSWLSGWTLNSDQLFHMLFGLGNLMPSHCKMMAIILGLIETGPETPVRPPPTPEDQADQLANALNAVALAGSLDVNLLVDA
ncbi:MAG: hypothetical protein ACJ8FY_28930 [Gemmataceae bacterium]